MLEIKSNVSEPTYAYTNGSNTISEDEYSFLRDKQYFTFGENRETVIDSFEPCLMVPEWETDQYSEPEHALGNVTPARYVTELKCILKSVKDNGPTQMHRRAIIGKSVDTSPRKNYTGRWSVATRVVGQYVDRHKVYAGVTHEEALAFAHKVNEITKDFIIS